MITNAERTVVVSSLGWIDHDALWIFDAVACAAERRSLGSGARYLSLHSAGSSYFSVGHHFDGARVEFTVHGFSDPADVLARATIDQRGSTLAGDGLLWKEVPTIYVAYLSFEPWNEHILIKICPTAGQVEIQRFEWYDSAYDKDYQSVIGALALPGGEYALISVQRSSDLIIHDLATGRKKGTVRLGRRGGNPTLKFRERSDDIWASDYDSLIVLDGRKLRVVRSARLQGSAAGTQQFIGDYSFVPGEPICIVARPFSGDVVVVDAGTLRVKSTARIGRQPLEAVALAQGRVVARDWRTGDLLQGSLERRRFWLW